MNVAIVGLVGHRGLSELLADAGTPTSVGRAAELLDGWWRRYPAAASFRDFVLGRIAYAVGAGLRGEIVAPDGRKFGFSPAELAGVELGNRGRRGAPSAFSAIWRCIEGVVIDRAIAALHPFRASHDLRFVLGMYDGVIYSAPAATAGLLANTARLAVEQAMRDVEAPGRATTIVDPYWIDKPREKALDGR